MPEVGELLPPDYRNYFTYFLDGIHGYYYRYEGFLTDLKWIILKKFNI